MKLTPEEYHAEVLRLLREFKCKYEPNPIVMSDYHMWSITPLECAKSWMKDLGFKPKKIK